MLLCPRCYKPVRRGRRQDHEFCVYIPNAELHKAKQRLVRPPKVEKIGKRKINIDALKAMLKKNEPTFYPTEQVTWGGRSPHHKPTYMPKQKPITDHLAPPGAKPPTRSHLKTESDEDGGMGSYQDIGNNLLDKD